MASNKKLRFELAQDSLAMANKMLARLDPAHISTTDLSPIQDAANQSTQAANQLNQLVGLLLAELERSPD